MNPNRLQTLFLNLGHFFDHMLILIYATAVISISIEFDKSYGEILVIATPGFFYMAACQCLSAGWATEKAATDLWHYFSLALGSPRF